MKKKLFLIIAFIFIGFVSSAQTKKDGTPDMRYSSNKQTYSAPSTPAPSNTDYSSSRPVYSGDTHTTSHGGTYTGEQNTQSHKGGTYRNPKSNDQYGVHKKK